ncbi:hypothetical protein M433DRAFT_62149 [Acidomyces richmondensis BFW]|nr:MAG: hypothetical protein FE78DRAFT_139585 [Acidomyces sp. 'richmondensis']KYG47912.1 hypothetical protein M433DRAFT_62149 [Acidomyces richmondensis BFW]
MVEPTQEGRPLDSPLAPSHSSLSRRASQASQFSFGRRYDQVANEVQEQLETVPPSPPKDSTHMRSGHEGHEVEGLAGAVMPPQRPHSSDTFREAEIAFKDFDGVHFSPHTDEFVEFDKNGNEVRRVSAHNSSAGFSHDAASMPLTPRGRPFSSILPPPAEGMVYYPAPVPRMLNLPKRLSQLPAANVQAKRRSEVLSQLPLDARRSAPWLTQANVGETQSSRRSQDSGCSHPSPKPYLNERMSMATLHNLPPQLRASVFFEHQSISQKVEVKSESAVATLDSILAASATAPVNAFTDHPFAGDVTKSVYAPEPVKARKSNTTLGTSVTLEDLAEKDKKKKRRSSIGNLLRRSSSGEKLSEQLKKNGSRSSMLLDLNEGGNKLQKRRSQLSLAGDLDGRRSLVEPVQVPGNGVQEPDLTSGLIAEAQNAVEDKEKDEEQNADGGSRPITAPSGRTFDEAEQIEADFKEEEAQEDVEEGEPVYAAPTTLLAELQLRKANQKSRNRTAATAFPNGMHSTLLELDAVEEIRRNKRKAHRVPLAWEDPATQGEEADEDDDVPLGMLFPSKSGVIAGKKIMGDGKDWDRPLGLMEQRELEDNEPLASRRNRLQGLPPDYHKAATMPAVSDIHFAGVPETAPGEDDEDAEGETLAQRLRRLKTKDALDSAVSEVIPKEGERPVSTFTDDVLSQFGGLEGKENPSQDDQPKPAEVGTEEEETLGQRRARLQREREASSEKSAARQPLGQSSSLANLLSSNPVGVRKVSREHQPVQGTLLYASAQQQAKQKAELENTNLNPSLHRMEKPLVNVRQKNARATSSIGLIHQSSGVAAHGGFAGGMYNNGLGGITLPTMQTSTSTPMVNVQGTNSYFASPTAAAMGYRDMVNPTYGMQTQPQMINLPAYQALNGDPPMPVYGYPSVDQGYGYGMPAHTPTYGAAAMGMGITMDPPLDAKQRDAIDRWRMSVTQ